MPRITFRCARLGDCALLARMNQQLIRDEGSRNPMDLAALAARMRRWLDTDWHAILIELNQRTVGYCLYQQRCDADDAQQSVIYVRQFFVARVWRRQGIGRLAFERIAGVMFPDEAILELDVLTANQAGQAFWASMGFEPICVTVRRPSLMVGEGLYASDDVSS